MGTTNVLDAALLVRFAQWMAPSEWTPPTTDLNAIHRLMRQRETSIHLRRQFKNQQHAHPDWQAQLDCLMTIPGVVPNAVIPD